MTIRVKTYVLIAVICYTLFLGWYLYKSQELSNTRWCPSDVYTQVGSISETTANATSSSADQVFDAKVNVPMTSRSKHRIANYKRTGKQSVRMMAFSRRKSSSSASVMSPTNTHQIIPVGGGLHLLSNATFRSFGAWGLMSTNYGRMRKNNPTNITQTLDATAIYLYPWYITPQDATSGQNMGAQSAMTSTSSQLTSTGRN